MKRDKILHFAVTEDEARRILEKLGEKITRGGKLYTMSSFLRDTILGAITNGDCSPSQEPENPPSQEIEPNEEKPREKGPWDDIQF